MRTVRTLLLAGLVAAAMPLFAKAPPPLQTVIILRLDGELAIDAAGAVSDVRIATVLDTELRQTVERAVRAWRFRPVLENGVAQPAKTRIRLALAATRIGADYQVSVDSVVFPAFAEALAASRRIDNDSAVIAFGTMRPPTYPRDLMFAGVSGRVLLAIRIGADGRVTEVAPVQSLLFDVRGRDKDMASAIRVFEGAALSAARNWRFTVSTKTATPTASDMTSYVPVEFLMDNVKADAPGQWRTVVRAAHRPVPWLPAAEASAVGVSDVANDEVLSLASRPVQLATPVVGRAL